MRDIIDVMWCRTVINIDHLGALGDNGHVVDSLQAPLALTIVLGVVGQEMLFSPCNARLIVMIYYLVASPRLFQEKL